LQSKSAKRRPRRAEALNATIDFADGMFVMEGRATR